MKKLLFVLLAVLMTSVSFAQFTTPVRSLELNAAKGVNEIPGWAEINTPFVATDVYGNTVDLAAILNSGHGVVLDYSGYWCGPCWNVHTSGILEAIDELSNVEVIWVEGTNGTTMDHLNGTNSQSWGNWLETPEGDPVPYPVIVDADNGGACLATLSNFYANAVPMIVFIAPNGYACDIYGYSFGIASFDAATVAANISALMTSYPQAGQAPIAAISGPARARVGAPVSFSVEAVSIDPITNVEWTFQGATPATATGNTASCTWNAAGNYTVTVAVTNANGTTTATLNVEAYNQDPNLLSYVGGSTEISSFLGTNGGEVYWGAAFPSSVLPANKYVKSVSAYIGSSYSGNYELIIYEGGSMTSPGTAVYRKTYNLTGSDSYQTLTVGSAVAVDNTKNLWVVLHTNGITYPMAGVAYTGDQGSDVLSTDGSSWSTATDNGFDLSWAIECTLGDSPNTGISETLSAGMNLYPNPTTGILNINAEGVQSVMVMDVDGRVVMTANSNVIDMTNLNNGVYFVRVISANGTSTQKVVKK